MIADQLLAPILKRSEDRLRYWRFHRRWAQDETGHQFSFIFYTSIETARQITTEVEAHPLLDELIAAKLLKRVMADHKVYDGRSKISATSDPGWPIEIQREWPNYIMGASRMWLGLVRSEAEKRPDQPLVERYQAVEAALTELWFKKANHAFFHHLSALFGYKPVRVIRRDIMTF